MTLLDGRKTSNQIKDEIARKVKDITNAGSRPPHLAAILVGEDGASKTYVNAKVKACERVGFKSTLINLPGDTDEKKLLMQIQSLNDQPDLDGFIVQLPLPSHIDEQKVINAVNPKKDVDGFHPANVGKMVLNLPTFLPATPKGIMELIHRYGIDLTGKNVVVIGRSHIVGSPISILMARNAKPGNATVTLTHSRTTNLPELTRKADVIVVALGKAEFLKADMVKDGVVIVDVGITRIPDAEKKSGYRLVGDVDFQEVSPKASFITPVPGGVGPMTIASLLSNTLQAYLQNHTVS
jgi:methylenetetrahydrofolate dehydrogenase (NADP+)/methenyltetrahydrofolate cyclohydrolase